MAGALPQVALGEQTARTSVIRRWIAAPERLSIILLVVVWEVYGQLFDTFWVPPLSRVLVTWWELLASGTLLPNVSASLGTFAIGIAISIVVGVLVGALMARFRKVEYMLDVYINALLAAPMIAFVPVLVAVIGLGYMTRVVTVILFALFVIIVNTFTGIRQVDPSLVEMARSFGANDNQMFFKVTLPGSLPLTLTGIELGISRGIKGMINGEVLIAIVGLGGMVMQYGGAYAMDKLYAIVLTIIVIAMLANSGVRKLRLRLLRWS